MDNKLFGGIIGLVVGDALGVPVEFTRRTALKQDPVKDMREFGTYNQPKGTWSDDSTMTLCLAESLASGLDYDDICTKFCAWVENGYMTPHGELFDIGIATRNALQNFADGVPPLECGGESEFDNGNGSLMRILPLAFYTFDMPLNEKFSIVENVSSLTHRHMRSKIACSIYVQFVCELLKGYSKEKALKQTTIHIKDFYKNEWELKHFNRITSTDIAKLSEGEIQSSGYVVHSLEAAMWCFFTTISYKDCVLKAVNLGEDTDTIAAIAGGLAGVYYEFNNIPQEWADSIVKLDKIVDVCNKLQDTYKPFDNFSKYVPIMQRKAIENSYKRYDKDASSYMRFCYDMGFMDFDYFRTFEKYGISGDRGEIIPAIESANIELLLAINTYYLRAERFCEGMIAEHMANGVLESVLTNTMRRLNHG